MDSWRSDSNAINIESIKKIQYGESESEWMNLLAKKEMVMVILLLEQNSRWELDLELGFITTFTGG